MNIIWSKSDCTYCDRAKDFFEYKGLSYEERNVEGGEWTLDQMLEAIPGARTFPQIFMEGKYIGGYQELVTHLAIGNISL